MSAANKSIKKLISAERNVPNISNDFVSKTENLCAFRRHMKIK
jgi:hypothetical protein